MKEANSILKLSYSFALDAAAAAISMCQRQEYDLACQFWRASTSIYANVEEARASRSRADFKSKISIAALETQESIYWLRMAQDIGGLVQDNAESLLSKASSIQKILTSILKTTSENP